MRKAFSLLLFFVGLAFACRGEAVPPSFLGPGFAFDPSASDEFDGAALDGTKWLDWVASFPGRSQGYLFARDNVAVKDGKLELTARLMREDEKTVENLRRGFDTYATGMIKAQRKTHYGYYECRAKTMHANVCNAFWLYDPLSDQPKRKFRPGDHSDEIDIFELFGKKETRPGADCDRKLYFNVHCLDTPYLEGVVNSGARKLPNKAFQKKVDFDFWADYHVYGFLWTEERLTWYVDGQEMFSRTNDVFKRPLHVTFNCEIKYTWTGEPDKADLPQSFSVDYFRFWRQSGPARRDGETQQPSVVLPVAPTEVERAAAAELADGIRRMTGVEPRMVSESSARTDGKRFYVGRTQRSREAFGESPAWKDDEIAIRAIADGLVLDGNPQRGPIYAVDTYLEDACGVRWWTSSESVYPRLQELPMKGIDSRYAPPFKYRETYYLDALDPTFKVRLKGNVTSRTKYVKRQPMRIAPEQGGDSSLHFFPERKSAYHSNLVILPPSAHFAAHPEWYSLVDGVRKPVQLCMTNPEMKAEYIRSIRKLLAAHPESDFIQVSQNDGRIVCQCERCRAAEAEDGLSGLYLGFANDVAAAIEKDFPQVTVDTFAYRFTRRPPKRTRPRHNVTVRLCDIECAFNAPLAGSPLNADFLADLDGWREIAAGRLYLWDYTTDFSACMIPHPNLHVLADNVRLFARSGALGVFAQGDATCRAGFMAPLMAWTMSHLLWKPEADGRRLVDEFLSGYYGKAAPHLWRALSVVEEGGRRAAERGEAVGCYHVNVEAFWTKEEALRFCDSIAAAIVAAENETIRRRVRREELSADLVRLLNWKSWELGSEDERQELLASWEVRCREFGVESYREAFGADDFDRCVATLKRGQVPDGTNTPKRKVGLSPAPTEVKVSERFGYDPVDATEILQRALDSGLERIVIDAAPGVWVSRPLVGRSNQTVVFEKGAFVRAKRGEFHDLHQPLLKYEYCTNVTLVGAGPDVCGLRMWHEDYTNESKYAKSEWRHALSILSSANVRIEGIALNESGGDGLYISTGGRCGSLPGKGPVCRDVIVRNCTMDRNCRQGLTVIGVDGLLVEDCVMTNTSGMPPEAGVDLEPNQPADSLVGIVFRRCRFAGNRGMGIDILTANHDRTSLPVSMLFVDCETVGNAQAVRYANGTRDADIPSLEGTIAFRRCAFRRSRDRAVSVARKPLSGGVFELSDCEIDGCGITVPDKADLFFSVYGHAGCDPDRYLLRNVVVRQDVAREPVALTRCPSGGFIGEPSHVEGEIRVECGGKSRRIVFDKAYRERNFPSRACPSVVPRVSVRMVEGATVVDRAPGRMVACAPVFVRGRGRFYAFHADKAGAAHFKVVQSAVGRVKSSRGFSLHRLGEETALREAFCPLPQDETGAVVSVDVPAAGFYELGVETAGKGLAIVATDVPVALDVTAAMKSLVGPKKGPAGKRYAKSRGRLYFDVSAGKTFACTFSCDAAERIGAEIFDPSGRSAWTEPSIFGFGVGQVENAAGGLWSLEIGPPKEGRFEDYSIGLNGVPGWYFLANEKYWRFQ